MSQSALHDLVVRLRRGATRDATAQASCDSLLERFVRHRDELAFEALVYRHGPKVYAVCRRLVGDRQLAEDAFQATFIVLARKAHSITPRSAVGGFLYGVARRCALEAFSMSRRRKETLVSSLPDTAGVDPDKVDPDVLEMLDAEIANLSEAYRAAVVMCELDGVTRSEAAERLGIAEGTLSSRLAAARKQLAARLLKRGVVFSAGLMSVLAESSRAAVPTVLASATAKIATGVLSSTAMTLADGVLRTMLMSKLKLAGFMLAMTLFGLSLLLPGGTTETTASPIPKEKADAGLIWVCTSDYVLSAYTPEGKVERKIQLKDGDHFLGLTPDGTKILFAGKKGKLAPDEKSDLTVHRREIGDGTEGEDLGVGYIPMDQFVWSPDQKKVVRLRLQQQIDPVSGANSFDHVLFDLETKKEKQLDIPAGHQINRWSADGKTWWVHEYAFRRDPKLPAFRWHLFPVEGGASKVFNDAYSLMGIEASPDGKTELAFGQKHDATKPFDFTRLTWFSIDAQTGKFTDVREFEPVTNFAAKWSPDSSRVGVLAYGYDKEKSAYGDAILSLFDPDGKNEKQIVNFGVGFSRKEAVITQKVVMLGWFPAKPAPKQTETKPKEPKDEGCIWLYDSHTGVLKALHPSGEKLRSWRVPYGSRVRGVTPDGTRIVFEAEPEDLAPNDGRDDRVNLKLHTLELSETGKVTEWDLEDEANERMIWSRDGKRFARHRMRFLPDLGESKEPKGVLKIFSAEGKKERELPLMEHLFPVDWWPDGEALLMQQAIKDEKGVIRFSLYKLSLADGKATLLIDRGFFAESRLSPDGNSILGFEKMQPKEQQPVSSSYSINLFDLQSGKTRRIGEPTSWWEADWSPDSTRIFYRRESAEGVIANRPEETKFDFVVCNVDGKQSKTILTVGKENLTTKYFGWTPTPGFLKEARK